MVRELQAPDGVRTPGARDDVQVGVEGPGGQDDVNGALVRVDGGYQSLRALDAGLLQDLFL